MKTNSSLLSQGPPQKYGQKPNFWNIFTQQTQHFLCTSNELRGPKTKKTTQVQRNRHNNTHASTYVYLKWPESWQNKKLKHKNRIKKIRDDPPPVPRSHPSINQPSHSLTWVFSIPARGLAHLLIMPYRPNVNKCFNKMFATCACQTFDFHTDCWSG